MHLSMPSRIEFMQTNAYAQPTEINIVNETKSEQQIAKMVNFIEIVCVCVCAR